MKIFFIILGIILLAAAVFQFVKGSRTSNPMKKAIGLFIAAFGVVFLSLSSLFTGSGKEMDKYMSRIDYVQGYALGNFMKEKYAGKTVCALVRDDIGASEQAVQKEILKGVEATFGTPIQVHVMKIAPRFIGEPTPEAPNTSNLLAWKKSLSAASFDEAFSGTGSDVVLNFAGLPFDDAELRNVNTLNTGSPILVFLNGAAQNPAILVEPVKRGTAVFVMTRTDAGKLTDIPRTEQDAFNAHFILVTADNVDELAKSEDYKYILNDPALSENDGEEAEPQAE